MILNKNFIQSVLSSCLLPYKDSAEVNEFSVDSRTLKSGDFFVALRGSHHDGHSFVSDVVTKGAVGCMIQKGSENCLDAIAHEVRNKLCVIVVPDTKKALGELASAWRNQFTYPVACVTGSVGKTTVKNLISLMLDSAGISHVASKANQNSYIGLCLNILKMSAEHKAAVFECGITRRGEMRKLVEIVRPTVGVITNIGHSHMEGLGSLTDIAAEKRTLFSLFNENNIGIVNGDQALLASVGYPHPTVKFGTKTTNQIQARKISVKDGKVSFALKVYNDKALITLHDPHKGMIFNVLAAASCAYILGCSFSSIVKALELYKAETGRFEKVSISGAYGTVINDAYNASPESMKEALLALQSYQADGDKIAVLGDMLELGMHSAFWHRQLGRFLRKVPSLKEVILVGKEVEWTKKTLPVSIKSEHVATWDIALEKVKQLKNSKQVILVKGSRGMQLDNVVKGLAEQ
jgi:UDP-N-acetylmuramoyl-tripeptide--D-alanyl-D-alanine ligase